ncbi:tRNA preQ1(34) S-adenosylmethionine ribosyltransferase-isomerase QueA [Prochlorococcus sp. MIT 1307]|uniref:tRNA preQ1(34) S-adenosylmethionine ribosyltransferase-isomerase QueA n=1 Tax=Prochlorococcus sp. MIT 1307 TaxID=3096219 RepID=UPI002A75EEDE|nr:tRNA preQ1(34) S-adenosylmethionine ribosyltransferase-isomerase QueA [Prochlorococcus sp. MIT 1307]
MSNPKDSFLSSYDYELDPELIAQTPMEPRHAARLLIVESEKGFLTASRDVKVWDWKDELRAGDLLVINNTRVLKARLRVRLSSGGLAELLLLDPLERGRWVCLARPAKRMRPGDYLVVEAQGEDPIRLEVIRKDVLSGGRVIQFPPRYCDRETIDEFLERYGEVPLPPYIQRQDPSDGKRYQTRYATCPGAVAAPTAGLHLSDELLKALTQKGVQQARVTLHVGLGTFKPLEAEDLTHLQLHSEWVEVSHDVVKAVEDCRSRGGRVLAVGTTSVRALEAAFVLGGGRLKPLRGKVDLVIKPGYRFGVVDGLLTNFHLPKSSLLLLVSALIGRERLLALYAEAIERQYRFFSYGDAMWIPPSAVLPQASIRYTGS